MKANKIIICILAAAVVLYGCATLSTGTLGTLAEVEKYDENGNKVYARNELGVQEWKYDGSGKVVYAKDTSIGSEMWIDYDGEGKMTYRKSAVKNPRAAVSEVEEVWYDAHENEIKRVSNGRERKTMLEYDSAGNVIHRVEGWGNELRYEYDERGNRTREKCALLLTLAPQIFPQEKEEVSRNEIIIKASKEIRCKEYILDLRRWKDGKLATIDGWGRFSTFEITEKRQNKGYSARKIS